MRGKGEKITFLQISLGHGHPMTFGEVVYTLVLWASQIWPQIEHNAERNILGLSERVRKGRDSWGTWVLLSPGNALPQGPVWAHPIHEPSLCCRCPLWDTQAGTLRKEQQIQTQERKPRGELGKEEGWGEVSEVACVLPNNLSQAASSWGAVPGNISQGWGVMLSWCGALDLDQAAWSFPGPAVWPWERNLTALCLSFPVGGVTTNNSPTSQGSCQDQHTWITQRSTRHTEAQKT